jgi:hypothetical protein
VKRCACGLTYDPLAPERRVGTHSIDGGVFLLANCDCGSTGYHALVPCPADVLERLVDDSEPLFSHERDTREEDAA